MNLVDIENYEGLYKFNKDLDKVYNVKTKKYIKNGLNGKYYIVSLYKDGKTKPFRLNHLICKYNNKYDPDDFVDIDDYKGLYKFDKKINQVINIITGKYLTNNICDGYYKVCLYKNKKIKHFLLHRLVYQLHNPLINIEGSDIDHINQVKTDNNINNLRIATSSENNCNRKIHKNNKLGIKNIVKTKSNTFTVQIMKDGKIYSKTFKSLDEAIEHRDLKLKELHGEFACF